MVYEIPLLLMGHDVRKHPGKVSTIINKFNILVALLVTCISRRVGYLNCVLFKMRKST